MTGIKIPAPLFICKHPGILGAAAPFAELLPQVQQGFVHHSLQVSLYKDGRKGQLDEASAVWRILLKLAPWLQKAFLETTSFKKAGKYKHIRIRKTQDLDLEMAGSKASLQPPAENKPACYQT